MNFPAFALLALAVAATGGVHAADVHKCVIDGRTTYQGTPCPTASASTSSLSSTTSSMTGCYVVDMPGFENGFQVKRTGSEEFVLETPKDKQSLAMKTATPEELHDVSAAFHLRLREGVSLKWNKGTPNQKPIGVYKGQDAGGKEIVFAYFFMANGLATAAPCK